MRNGRKLGQVRRELLQIIESRRAAFEAWRDSFAVERRRVGRRGRSCNTANDLHRQDYQGRSGREGRGEKPRADDGRVPEVAPAEPNIKEGRDGMDGDG